MYAAYPVYIPSRHYAKQYDEIELWRESYKINKECRDYINANAGFAYHDKKLPEFIQNLTETYGLERAIFVMARFIIAADWDKRYDRDVRERAEQVDFQDMKEAGANIKSTTEDITCELYSNVHPCILNSIFRSLMKMEQKQVNLPGEEHPHDNGLDEGVEP